MKNKLIRAVACIVIFVLGVFVSPVILEPRNQDLEFYTPYDILYISREKDVWVVHSEVEPFHKVVTYREGLKLISELSGLDTDEYHSFIMNTEEQVTPGQKELDYYLNKVDEFNNK